MNKTRRTRLLSSVPCSARPFGRHSALASTVWLTTALGVALAWPAAAKAASDVCYQGGPTLANFKLNGTATLGGTSIVLTQDSGNQGGSAMYETKFNSASDFHVNMYVKISTTSSPQPADGMAFIMHNDPRGVTALGGLGIGVGYAGIVNSVTVEFDTYQNTTYGDPPSPHIAITKGGDANHTDAVNSGLPVVQFSSLNPPLNPTSGTPFYIWIDYSAASNLLNVYVSATSTKPATASLSATLNLATLLGSSFYVGYTGSTGGAWDKQEFLQLYASDNLPTAAGSCCNTNADCTSSSAGTICDSAKHVCGTCLVSSTSTCSGGTTGCDMSGSHDVCAVACNGNFGVTGVTHPCSSSAYPACLTAGAGIGSCAACNGDNGSSAAALCAASAPFCSSNGYCGLCTVNSDCTTAGATHAGSFCNSTTGKCLSTCAADADCGPSNACLSSACVAKAANGANVPGGTCSAALALRYCTAGVCNSANKTCGAANGQPGCTTATAAAYCQSGACSTAGVCIPAAPGSCDVDGECASGSYCNQGTFTCTHQLAAGAAIPTDGLHNGLCTPFNATAACVSGACNLNANTCAGANAAACGVANQCVANVCGSNGRCGAANGQSGCTGGTAVAYCQSGACDTGGVCIPSGAGSCYVDADCASGFCRRDLFTCVAALNPGVVIPNDGLHGGICSAPVASVVCASGGCDAAANTCASPLSASCTGAGDCQVNVCGGNGLCGYASGTGACSGATASTLCQSGACSGAGGVCIPASSGACWIDADCSTGRYCNQGTLACVPKLPAGAPIPVDSLHDGTCNAAAAVCGTGLCNGVTGTCGASLGAGCTSANQCAGDLCGSNGALRRRQRRRPLYQRQRRHGLPIGGLRQREPGLHPRAGRQLQRRCGVQRRAVLRSERAHLRRQAGRRRVAPDRPPPRWPLQRWPGRRGLRRRRLRSGHQHLREGHRRRLPGVRPVRRGRLRRRRHLRQRRRHRKLHDGQRLQRLCLGALQRHGRRLSRRRQLELLGRRRLHEHRVL